ncbi:MAG: hypothetical protein ACRD82_00025 [Blastocatellia bacterium]
MEQVAREQAVTLEGVLQMAKHLSVVDKVRLVEKIAPEIERGIQITLPASRKSLRGLWRGLNVSDEDIAEARREMWGDFPRSGI